MKQISNSDGFISKFDQKDKEKIISILHKPFQRTEGEEKLLNSFYDAVITLVSKPENHYNERDPQTTMSHRNRHNILN